MSIPKEPRQLLINLMYIVLTALLALNVSAEVLHAFFSMDDSMSESNRLMDGSNRKLADAISDQAAAYTQFEPYKEKAKKAQETASEFFALVEKMKAEVVEAAGGIGEDNMPVRKADKDIPTRLLVQEGRGETLKNKVIETREKLLSLIDDPETRTRIGETIPLKIKEIPTDSKKKDWAQFHFEQMPVAAVMPMLTKFQSDVKVAETAILNYFADQLNVTTVKPDQFTPVIASEQNYVIRGEQFRGEIFLAAYSSTADNISVSVDGQPLDVKDGKAIFTSTPSSNGNKQHEMTIRLTNPLTGETQAYSKQFNYEVGERSVAVSLDKMNVFYVGVENPISISAAGIPSNKMQVNATGVELRKSSNGKYVAIPQKTGRASITVSGGGLQPTIFDYTVKRIPDPTVKLGNLLGGQIPVAHFQAQMGLIPHLINFDFEAKAEIKEFELVRIRKGDAATAKNKGGGYGSEAKRLVDNAQRGDIYYFDNIKVRCPGDEYNRPMPGLMFTLK
ncbi:MAG: gliding motility protein GldM [Saprospiraceae bacterium]